MAKRKITPEEALEAVRDAGGSPKLAAEREGVDRRTMTRALDRLGEPRDRVAIYVDPVTADILRRNEIGGLWGRLREFVWQEAENSGDAVFLYLGGERRRATAEELEMEWLADDPDSLTNALPRGLGLDTEEILGLAAKGRVYFSGEGF